MPRLVACVGIDGMLNPLGGGCPPAVGKGVPDMCGFVEADSMEAGQCVPRVGASFVDALTVAAAATAAAEIVVVASQQGLVGAGRGWSSETLVLYSTVWVLRRFEKANSYAANP
jgi:hypothetical protein